MTLSQAAVANLGERRTRMAQETELHSIPRVLLRIIPLKRGCIGPKHLDPGAAAIRAERHMNSSLGHTQLVIYSMYMTNHNFKHSLTWLQEVVLSVSCMIHPLSTVLHSFAAGAMPNKLS